jgi:cysteine desulfurase
MLANNEIGALQDLPAIAEICHRRGALLHTDATQAFGRIAVNVDAMGIDLLSASAHKFYGPKGIGLLFVRRRGQRIRLRPMLEGGGQQHGLRSGTVNAAGVVAMAKAIEIADQELESETTRIDGLASRFWSSIQQSIPGCQLNGPLRTPATRLVGNLNICFPGIEGESLMSACPTLALSSGSACSSVDPAPSHVLLGIGLSESEARRSLRIGIGRFNTPDEIDDAATLLTAAHAKHTSC